MAIYRIINYCNILPTYWCRKFQKEAVESKRIFGASAMRPVRLYEYRRENNVSNAHQLNELRGIDSTRMHTQLGRPKAYYNSSIPTISKTRIQFASIERTPTAFLLDARSTYSMAGRQDGRYVSCIHSVA